VADFDQLSLVPEVSQTLREIYGHVDNIDAWVGALAEDHLPDSSVGPLILAGLVDQFTRLREGDRFFYGNDPDLSHPDIAAVIDLERVSLSQIVQLNTEIGPIHTPFIVEQQKEKPKAGDANSDLQFDHLDIVQVQSAGKYATGQPANWSEGDWNGDGLFNQFDIIAAMQTGLYKAGPFASVAGDAPTLAKTTPDGHEGAIVDGLFAQFAAALSGKCEQQNAR
jgi:hypothetical protein